MSKVKTLTPPVRGMVLAQPLQSTLDGAAELIENFLPTTRGIKVRGGVSKAADVTDPPLSMWDFNSPGAGAFFVATATDLYEVSTFDPNTPATPLVSSLTSGYFSAAQMPSAGGDDFLVMVNGSDLAMIYDGLNATVNPITDEAINNLSYDALVTEFSVGDTVTGGASGATAEVLAIVHSGTAGTLKIGAVTGGPFQDDETLTSAGGEATADGAEAAASSYTLTGVATSDLSYVWKHKSRLFFIEKDTMTVWYLGVDTIAGTLNDFSLAGTFKRGGSLKFGATWSFDAGDGPDDVCVIVSDQGEVAVFQGNDPSSASAWGLVGRYDISKPLGINAHVNAGGDLLIATEDGIVPLSQVRDKDPAAVSFAAVTAAIRPLWDVEADRATGAVELHKWTKNELLMVNLPDADRMLTAHLQTGAWAQQKGGWDGDCLAIHDGSAYLGRSDGFVYKLDVTGKDDDASFTARYACSALDFGAPALYKVAQMVRCSFFSTTSLAFKIEVGTDYNVEFGSAPAYAVLNFTTLYWDNGQNWNAGFLWGSDKEGPKPVLTAEWRAVSGAGYALAPMVQITSGIGAKMDVELVGIDLLFEQGAVVV